MTEKYYNYEHITDEVLKGAIEIIKVAEKFDMSPIEYEIAALYPYKHYIVYIQLSSDYHRVTIRESGISQYDYYEVSTKDYSAKYSGSDEF